MKYIVFIGLLFLFSCEKQECYECATIYQPYIKVPEVVQVTKAEANELHGQTGTYTDNLGNVFTYRVVCRECQ
jgi:hypothetical protein